MKNRGVQDTYGEITVPIQHHLPDLGTVITSIHVGSEDEEDSKSFYDAESAEADDGLFHVDDKTEKGVNSQTSWILTFIVVTMSVE